MIKFFKILIILLVGVTCTINAQSKKYKKKKIYFKVFHKSFVKAYQLENFKPGADNYLEYIPLLSNKNVGIVTNQSGIIFLKQKINTSNEIKDEIVASKNDTISIVDFLKNNGVNIQKIFAPEHGFRGTADAGEYIIDGKDFKTGLPIISLYGENKKPKPEQLKGIDIIIFDLQDVGARYYTYISTLHYVMEACAENNIQLMILDRPNPNGGIIDGPILEKKYSSFVGMHEIPILHGMTIGEYATMINGEKWLTNHLQCNLKIISCQNYNRYKGYHLPIKPSPNLPNDQAINLYPSLCLFEGTNISVGRGTKMQFQIYGSPFLPKTKFVFTPISSPGAKTPLYMNEVCNGKDLSYIKKINRLELKWLLKAYSKTTDKTKFFNLFFTRLTGTKKLQLQIEKGVSEKKIRKSWEKDLKKFKRMRKKYLIY